MIYSFGTNPRPCFASVGVCFIDIDFTRAFALYQAQRPFYPKISDPVSPLETDGLQDAIRDIDVVMLDAFGVLHAGQDALPGAVETVSAVRSSGRSIRVVSNDATREKADLLSAYEARGFDFNEAEIVASVDLIPEELARYPDDMTWGVVSRDNWLPNCLSGKFEIIDSQTSNFDRYDGFFFIATFGWETADTERLAASLTHKARPVVVANPDIAAPRSDGPMSTPPGFAAARLQELTGIAPHYFGKPFSNMFQRAMNQFPEVAADRFLMVGDTLHTDILGARAQGAKALLLTDTGFLRGQDWRSACERSGIWPDFVAKSI